MNTAVSTRVLHLIDSAGMYGAERVILTLLGEMKRSAFPGILGCIREKDTDMPEIAEEALAAGIPVEFFTMSRGISIQGLRQISRFARRNNIPVVHCHGYKPNIYMSLLPRKGVRVLSTVHGWAKQTAGLKGKIYEWLDAISLQRMDRVVAVSQAVANDLRDRGIKGDTVEIIYNGIQLPDAPEYNGSEIRQQFGLTEKMFVIGAVGRLVPVKGHKYLIKAMATVVKEIPDCKLLIAGEGPLRDELISCIKEHGLDAYVSLVGFQKPIARFLSMLDLFVMPSLSEGLPFALLEAIVAETPVVASRCGGIPEVITSDKQGGLVLPGDSVALAYAILELWCNADLRKATAKKAMEQAVCNFTSKVMGESYLCAYQKLVERGGQF